MTTAERLNLQMSSAIRLAILCVAIVLSLRTFQFFPGMGIVQETWFILVALVLVGIYIPWRLRQHDKICGFETYVVLLMVLIPVWSSLSSSYEFGQPIIFGLLAQRGLVLVAGIPLLFKMVLHRKMITLEDLEKALVVLAWFTLILFMFMYIFLDPSKYFSTFGGGFVSGEDADAIFAYPSIFLVFAFFYYGFITIKSKSIRDYLKSILFFLFMLLVVRGRSLVLFLLAVYFLFAILWSPNKFRILAFLFKISLTLGAACFILSIVNYDLFSTLFNKFSDAFTVVLTGEMTNDASANARIGETLVALPFITKNWLFGSGLLSNQWNDGFNSVLGYFHPSDIGIIGSIFVYGVLGTMLFITQFGFAYGIFKRGSLVPATHVALLKATKATILFIGIRSSFTGQFIFYPELSLFFISILLMIYNKNQIYNNNKIPTHKLLSTKII